MKSSRNDRSGRSAINRACVALLGVILACIALPALGQLKSYTERAVAEGTAVETADDVRSRLEALEKVADLDAALKEKLQELYGGALKRLEDADTSTKVETQFRGMIDTAPARIQEIGETLGRLAQSQPEPISIEETLEAADLIELPVKERAKLAALKSRLDKFIDQLVELNSRPAAAEEQLVVAKRRVDEVTTELEAPTPSDEPELLTEARQLNFRARLRARQAEIAMLEQELLTYELRLKLTEAERELAHQEHARAEKRVTDLEEELKQRLRLAARRIERETELAERKAVGKHPVVQSVAERNSEISHAASEIVDDLEKAAERRADIAAQMKQIEAELQRARKGLEIAGKSLGVGRFLRTRQRALPEMRGYDRGAAKRAALISEIGFRLFEVSEALEDLETVEAIVERLMAEDVEPDLSADQRKEIEAELNELLEKQKVIFEKLRVGYTATMLRLGEVDFDERQLVEKAEAYAKFLDERLMWIPTAPPPSVATLTKLADATSWLLSPAAWAGTLQTLERKFRQESPW
jgi:potassium efflux system protein